MPPTLSKILTLASLGAAIVLTGLGLWQNWAQWFFLCEVQFIGIAFLLLLPILGLTTERSLVLGAYEVDDVGSGCCVALAIGLSAVSIAWTAQLEFGLACVRLAQPLPHQFWPVLIGSVLLIAGVLLNLVVTHIVSPPEGQRLSWKRCDTGLFFGLALAIAFFVAGECSINFLSQHLDLRHLSEPLASLVANVNQWLLALPHQFTDGYIGKALVSHIAASLGLVVTLLIYLVLKRSPLPPLCCLALVATLLVWLFSGLAFFLQEFRIPAILPVAVWLFLASSHRKADHFYEVIRTGPLNLPAAADFLARYGPEKPMLVVTAAGGGIQAAAWAARVLAGIQTACDASSPGRFAESLLLVSGVSGGSTGLMYYLGTWLQPELNCMIASDAARASSLSEVTKALAYEDLGRAFFPFLVLHNYRDRGQALQNAWVANGRKSGPATYGEALKHSTLCNWGQKAASGQLPAVIFNSTIVEQGKRLAFSTIPLQNAPIADGFAEFSALYPGFDIPMAAAARLSATFTFVSPAARPDAPGLTEPDGSENLHLVDGGYLDNSGINGLVEWLKAALDLAGRGPTEKTPKKILLIQISGFPNPPAAYVKGQRGTFFQLWAPLLTLFTVRSTGHEAAAQRELALFQEACKCQGIDFDWITFQYQGINPANPTAAPETPPLSWHLTPEQKQAIDNNWIRLAPQTGKVRSFLGI